MLPVVLNSEATGADIPGSAQSVASAATQATTGEEDDAVSDLSSSSRSARYRGASLRRRAAESARPRRASEATSEEDVAALGTTVELEIQGAGKEGWGIGDDARMTLE